MADLNTLLNKLKQEREVSAWFTPVDANGAPFGEEGAPFQIRVLSRRSQEWREAEEAWQITRAVSVANQQKVTERDAKSFSQFMTKAHIAISKEWRNLTHEGEPVPMTPESLSNLCGDIDFKEQFFAFTANSRNYPGSGDEQFPNTEAEDAEKKSVSGASGDSLSATT